MAVTRCDLVKRTMEFAMAVRSFVNNLPKVTSNHEDIKQLVRSSGSVAANYIEAQEGVSRKDFFYRIKICRKEVRETGLWLRLVQLGSEKNTIETQRRLTQEADELRRIFATIASKDDTGK